MTELQLEELGLIADKSKLHPNRYWCNLTQTDITINKGLKAVDVMEIIFKIGYVQGIDTGKAQRIQEFKNLINNTETF